MAPIQSNRGLKVIYITSKRPFSIREMTPNNQTTLFEQAPGNTGKEFPLTEENIKRQGQSTDYGRNRNIFNDMQMWSIIHRRRGTRCIMGGSQAYNRFFKMPCSLIRDTYGETLLTFSSPHYKKDVVIKTFKIPPSCMLQ